LNDGNIKNLIFICSDTLDFDSLNLITAISSLCAQNKIAVCVVTTELDCSKQPSNNIDRLLVSWAERDLFDAYVLLIDSVDADPLASRIIQALSQKLGVLIGKSTRPLPAVIFENEKAMSDMIRHLYYDHGYRNFLFLLGPPRSYKGSQCETAIRREVSLHKDIQAEYQQAYFKENMAYDLVKERLGHTESPFPRVIVACNDHMAFGAMRALQEAGIKIPSQCAVTGFDDLEMAEMQNPSLTTVRQESIAAAHAVFDLINSQPLPENTSSARRTIPSSLILRESCGCSRDNLASFYRTLLASTSLVQSQDSRYRKAVSDFTLSVNSAVDFSDLEISLSTFAKVVGSEMLSFAIFHEPDYRLVNTIYPRKSSIMTTQMIFTQEQLFGVTGLSKDEKAVTFAFLLFVSGKFQGVLISQNNPRHVEMIRIVASNTMNSYQRLKMAEQFFDRNNEHEREAKLLTQSLYLARQDLEKEIEQRRQLENFLQQERESVEAFLNILPIPLFIISKKRKRVIYLNHPARELLQLGCGDFDEKFVQQVIAPVISWIQNKKVEEMLQFKIDDHEQKSHLIHISGTEILFREELSYIICLVDITQQNQLENEILTIAEEERVRIGMEIHDDICQQIAALSIYAGIIRDEVGELGKASTELNKLIELIHNLQIRVQAISKGLFPKDVGSAPITEVIQKFLSEIEKQTGFTCAFEAKPEQAGINLTFDSQFHLFRIVQEIVQNALKHANASKLNFLMEEKPHEIHLLYKDNGKGFDKLSQKGAELRTIRYRVAQISGHLTVGNSPEGDGAVINLYIPHTPIKKDGPSRS
jgi:signal transduction histidine kinase/DNA-binding LacI/PurR family transcriptional regulator